MKKINTSIIVISLFVILFSLYACEKAYEPVPVVYEISKSASGFKVTYMNEEGELITQFIETNSAEDKWTYKYSAKPRDIVYVSANYKDINSAILVRVLVNGKVYKQASTKFDTTMFVTVSGTIPE